MSPRFADRQSRRRVAFTPSVDALDARITPSVYGPPPPDPFDGPSLPTTPPTQPPFPPAPPGTPTG